ncbi:MAG: hypothetical protein AAGH74_07305 [Pseudomonadota bacterium]
MTNADTTLIDAPQEPKSQSPKPQTNGAIFHPVLDFLLLGGLTAILIPVMMMMPDTARPAVLATTYILADLINHPHFAASYQIFYRNYREKAFGTRLSRELRIRYIIAGIIAPITLIAFFATAGFAESPEMFGYGVNLMLFLVGWHYTKQGYGMLIVTSVYQKKFFTDAEKKTFLANAYTTWLFFWMWGNTVVREKEFWQLQYYTIPVPEWALMIIAAAAGVTTLMALRLFALRCLKGFDTLPWLGVMAYVVSIYVWLNAAVVPLFAVLIPVLHSLQYLTIVWRYESNRAKAITKPEDTLPWRGKLASFIIWSIIIGALGFWIIPQAFESRIDYSNETYANGFIFMFSFWIIINVHHYFLDNVIWRRENPDTGAYLFGAGPKKK